MTGLRAAECVREDTFYHSARKAKIHRAIPEAGYTATMEWEDDEPLDGETHDCVRVEQSNGQRAWSSPIWVKSAVDDYGMQEGLSVGQVSSAGSSRGAKCHTGRTGQPLRISSATILTKGRGCGRVRTCTCGTETPGIQ